MRWVRIKYVRFIQPWYFKRSQHKLNLKVASGERIKLCFLAMNLSMWRYQRVYERFASDVRFDVVIVLCPLVQFEKSEQAKDMQDLRNYFAARGISYIDWDDKNEKSMADLRVDINPDIIFYPQQYGGVYYKEQSFYRFMDKLLCLCPYGIANEESAWTYNTNFHNLAWKLFYTNQAELRAAQRLADNKGRNVVVTGYPNMTEYFAPKYRDPWKIKSPEVKRLIWAPHYSILENGDELCLSNFLWMCDEMVKIAEQYNGRLQIAFKPHPKLRSRLYHHSDWGQERTDKYYQIWDEMPNTQLETGEFIDLFKTSDAMVHDSDSFQIEYLYVNRPVMFVMRKHEQKNTSELRDRAIECHYIGKNMDDIRHFVEMVLNGEDVLDKKRELFFENYLLPEDGTDVALNIYNDIISSIGI